MATVKEYIEQLRSKLQGVKIDDKDVLGELNPILSGILAEHNTVETEREDAITQSKTNAGEAGKWRKKLREKETELENYKTENTSDELKTENETLKAQNAELVQYKTNHIKSKTDEFSNWFGTIKEHEKFEKVKDRLVIPEPDKEGNIVFTGLKEEEITANIAAMDDLNKLEYFESNGKSNKQFNNKMNFKNDKSQEKEPQITDKASLTEAMANVAKDEGIIN